MPRRLFSFAHYNVAIRYVCKRNGNINALPSVEISIRSTIFFLFYKKSNQIVKDFINNLLIFRLFKLLVS